MNDSRLRDLMAWIGGAVSLGGVCGVILALSMTLSSRIEDHYDPLVILWPASLGASLVGFALLYGAWKDNKK